MTYMVRYLDQMLDTEADTGEVQMEHLEGELNRIEEEGWKLVHILDQHRQMDEEGRVKVFSGPFFIFHKKA